jgi:Flp pilus assembly protein TadD
MNAHLVRAGLVVFFFGCPGLTSLAQQSGSAQALQAEAQRLQRAGDFAAAESAYDKLLQADPSNLEARLGRGHVRSWQRKFAGAKADFQDVLRADPNNISASNGLGYAFAWSGAYPDAEGRFKQTLAIAPDQAEALEGLAYVALWRGDAKEAVKRFQALQARSPTNAGIAVGLGQAHLVAGDRAAARTAFEQALSLEPGREDAKKGVQAASAASRFFEATLFAGHTRFDNGPGSANTDKDGVRFAELAYTPNPNLRFWAQYDNGLSLDNADLARQNREAATYYLGGLVHYLGRYTTRIELGHRNLPDGIGQDILRGEQVFFLPNDYTVKAGAWLGHREDGHTERIFHAGAGIPVNKAFRLEPTMFYSRTGVPGEKQWRGLIAGEYTFDAGYRIGGGFSAGRTYTATEDHEVRDVFLTASAPFAGRHRAHVFVRHEDLGFDKKTSVIGLGVTLAFPGE